MQGWNIFVFTDKEVQKQCARPNYYGGQRQGGSGLERHEVLPGTCCLQVNCGEEEKELCGERANINKCRTMYEGMEPMLTEHLCWVLCLNMQELQIVLNEEHSKRSGWRKEAQAVAVC